MSNGMECWFSPVASFRIAEKKSHGSHGSIFPFDCDVKIFIWKFSSSLRKSFMQKNEEIDTYEVIMLTFLLSKIACAPLECWSSLLCRHSCKSQRVKPIYVYMYIYIYIQYTFFTLSKSEKSHGSGPPLMNEATVCSTRGGRCSSAPLQLLYWRGGLSSQQADCGFN